MIRKYYSFIGLLFLLLSLSCSRKSENTSSNWCEEELRAELQILQEVETSSDWFKVYMVGQNVYAIAEPYNFQEVISYLILGRERALLFDSGMGLDSISIVVDELTDLPVTVLNSDTHYDHIGGNSEFDNIMAMESNFTQNCAKNGWNHDLVKKEVSSVAICLDKLPNADTANYRVKPFEITRFIDDGLLIDLGGRTIEVLMIPGHAPNSLSILDRQNGYVWTGDTFYEGGIWLFFNETDLEAYGKSIERLSKLVPDLTKVFPSHNKPLAEPARLLELKEAFSKIINGEKKGEENGKWGQPEGYDVVFFKFDHFSFLINKEHLSTN